MDSENGSVNSPEYFQQTSPETIFLQNTNQFLPTAGGFSNMHPFVTSSPLANGFQFPYPNMSYHTEPFKNFQSPLDKSNPFIVSRFKWTQDTKPEFSFSSNSHQPTCLNVNNYAMAPTGTFGYKRKTKSPPPRPLKQHITEERMAEHMSQLHISSETQMSLKESEPVRERRLYMCEEMQRLQAESIIPIQILEKVQRPCTALIPWQPQIAPSFSKENNNNEEEELDNSIPLPTDNGVMDTGLCEY